MTADGKRGASFLRSAWFCGQSRVSGREPRGYLLTRSDEAYINRQKNFLGDLRFDRNAIETISMDRLIGREVKSTRRYRRSNNLCFETICRVAVSGRRNLR
ncbi:MAG: hypothetical protein B1H40_02430 [Candidatus Latescibacteria bacterium 4484_181]|nr:MAG: hypothetical protein B1H40_02430 [Candidatus Latescibacteria bacterium 4484_181]RKY69578.1 MAG: hypothetical protein DRQ02_00610 [Candidatus Latescibacterota bacterium]RKY73629.1 MAG: hypothetical protein DRQ24_02060 [Candidatus Latescibacterota bacterium]